jgi:hypothetical protein
MNSRDHRTVQEEPTADLVLSFEAHQPQPSLFSPAELPPRLWTLDEVAEFLQMSPGWVRDHGTRRQPRLPMQDARPCNEQSLARRARNGVDTTGQQGEQERLPHKAS